MKHILTIIVSTVFLFGLAGTAHAEFWACFTNGQVVDFCNPASQDRDCSATLCKYCMSAFDEENNCYLQGSLPQCNAIEDQACVLGNGSIDSQPPTANIISPENGGIYGERSIFIDIQADEVVDIDHRDNIAGRGRWTSLCQNCLGYARFRNFGEGLNDITYRVSDAIGNPSFYDVSFLVDSKAPAIRKAEPRGGFANGIFTVEFTEENPHEIALHFGNAQTGFSSEILNFATVGLETQSTEGCTETRGRHTCVFNADIEPYDGQDLEYHFEVEDIAGLTDSSRISVLSVDTTDPVINSLDHSIGGKRVEFTLDITEENFESAQYIDHLSSRPRLSSLCTRLNGNVCSKTVSFQDGPHEVDIIVTDQAGNEVVETLSFFTDGKDPRINSAEPRRGFANGDFSVIFTEANPNELTLHYGNDITGLRTKDIEVSLDLETGSCILNRGKYSCTTSVSLDDYDGQSIEYWFTLTDLVDNIAESRQSSLDVDVTFPVLNSVTHTVDGRRVTLSLDVTEENFDVAEYVVTSDARPRFRTLCSRLSDGLCEKRITFKEGTHDVSIQVLDEAGNAVGQSLTITTE